ncbi:MAG: glycosyltransferase family 2 protein [Vicingaceae bacterium]|nr:glycosyltransferase family 2 protein [Vicingaceae bacterium]
MNPKVSIITVCYNSAKTIEDTIQSVINQTYDNIEYIIVDGLSTDNTLKIVNKYQDKIAKVVSEKDAGLYDAINKGIGLAIGDIIANINSDDFYIDNNVIADVVAKMEKEKSDTLYADLYYVEAADTNKVTRNWVSGAYKKGMFFKGWMPPHPTFFVRKSVYNNYGKFNLELKSAADYEIMLRFIHKHECSIVYLPRVVVKMRVGGVSNSSLKNRLKANREDKRAWEINELKPKPYTLIFKPLSKVLQFMKK